MTVYPRAALAVVLDAVLEDDLEIALVRQVAGIVVAGTRNAGDVDAVKRGLVQRGGGLR